MLRRSTFSFLFPIGQRPFGYLKHVEPTLVASHNPLDRCGKLGPGFHQFAPSLGLAQTAVRTWHAASGGFSVDAELIDVREDKVQLKKKDGSAIWVELNKLSLADIRFVEESMNKAREDLRKKLGNSQPSTQPAPANGKPKEPDESPSADGARPNEPEDQEKGERLPGWEIEVDASGTKSPFAGMREVNLVLSRASSHDLLFPATPSTWMAFARLGPGGQQYQVANIRTGKVLEPIPVENFAQQKALSPDGSMIAFAVGFPSKLSIYSSSNGKKIKELATTELNSLSKMFFLPSQQLLVLGQGGRASTAVIYDVKTGKATKTFELDSGFPSKIAISPSGKILAIPSQGGTIGLYDTKLGKKKMDLAIVPSKEGGFISVEDLAFCRDGNELVVIGSSTTSELNAFSMKTGRVIAKHVLSDRLSSLFSGQNAKSSTLMKPPSFDGTMARSIFFLPNFVS